jgi:integrase
MEEPIYAALQREVQLKLGRCLMRIQQYELLLKEIGTDLDAAKYRGLLPHQPLIYSGRGAALSQNTKRTTLETGERRDYKACDSLQSHITRLYKRAGINGSSHSGRRGFAGKVLAATGDMATVAVLLGPSSLDCSQRYVDVDVSVLREMFEGAV